MKKLSTNQIRRMWLDFFQEKNHHLLPPASLIPVNDLSLLWINSGVATLKPYFDGRLVPPASRLVNSQKALRTNDVENVGVTARHQTLFEMLGNFSIGDYFKEEALTWAWELLTSPKWFGLDPKKLYITVFEQDKETYRLWTEKIGVAKNHIFKMGRETNFWDIGQGPAGPNTEIFFDRGAKWDSEGIGPRLIQENKENDRYVEIWNIVFSQFNNDGKGNYTDLPTKNIDTGAGLERLASIFQETPTNFETDLFWPVISELQTLVGNNIRYSVENYLNPSPKQTKTNTAFKVIADHLRAAIFALNEGISPANKDRGYVVRRLLRRAQVYGLELGLNRPFLHQLVTASIQPMVDYYPELKASQSSVQSLIRAEEEKFFQTLERGHKLLNELIKKEKHLSAKNIWLLFESFGFPIDLTLEIGRKNQISVDYQGVEELRQRAQERSRSSRHAEKGWNKQSELYSKLTIPSQFTGWNETTRNQAKVTFLFQNEEPRAKLENETGFLLLDKTPFYAEKGGQAPDQGLILGPRGQAKVIDVQEGPRHQPIHQVQVKGKIEVGQLVQAIVDPKKRALTQKNHTATHLLHSALRSVLGPEVKQSGSYNDEAGLRLDFSFSRPLTDKELEEVQRLVRFHIALNHPAEVLFVSLEEAINEHQALAFFGDKYEGDQVRIVKFGNFSCELCGGTHVTHTREIEDFLISEISSKGKGIFRIKALTSHQTIKAFLEQKLQAAQDSVHQLEVKLKNLLGSPLSSFEKISRQIKDFVITSKNWTQLSPLLESLHQIHTEQLRISQIKERDRRVKQFYHLQPTLNQEGINRIELFTSGLSLADLKHLADYFRSHYPNLVVILGSGEKSSGFLVVALSPELKSKHSALEIFSHLPGYRTRGGGSTTFVQGKYELIPTPKRSKQ